MSAEDIHVFSLCTKCFEDAVVKAKATFEVAYVMLQTSLTWEDENFLLTKVFIQLQTSRAKEHHDAVLLVQHATC